MYTLHLQEHLWHPILNWALCSYNSFHSPGKAFYKILKCLWKCLPIHPEEHFWGQTPMWDTHNLCSSSSQRCLMGLRSGLYVGQSSSSTPNSSNISFLDLVWKVKKVMVNLEIRRFRLKPKKTIRGVLKYLQFQRGVISDSPVLAYTLSSSTLSDRTHQCLVQCFFEVEEISLKKNCLVSNYLLSLLVTI